MPVSWGGSPNSSEIYSGYDLAQFSKFFDLYDMDFEIRRISGLWEVIAWTRHSEDVFSIVAKQDNLSDALYKCYTEVRAQLRRRSPDDVADSSLSGK